MGVEALMSCFRHCKWSRKCYFQKTVKRRTLDARDTKKHGTWTLIMKLFCVIWANIGDHYAKNESRSSCGCGKSSSSFFQLNAKVRRSCKYRFSYFFNFRTRPIPGNGMTCKTIAFSIQLTFESFKIWQVLDPTSHLDDVVVKTVVQLTINTHHGIVEKQSVLQTGRKVLTFRVSAVSRNW